MVNFMVRPSDHINQHSGCPICGRSLSINENEIFNFVKNELKITNVRQRDRTVIPPYELDIYIPDKRIAIEYDGLLWHSEKYNKYSDYHITKTELCEKQGIKMIHIFEDEYKEHKDIVLEKLRHILHRNNKTHIFARQCNIREISSKVAKQFLEKNHIQGFVGSSVYLGCYFHDELIGVMSLKKENNNNDKWELTRFAGNINYVCCGIGGKLFNYFIKNYSPKEVKSFADRRWTSVIDTTIYDKLGFVREKILKPDYSYVINNKRIHKFSCRKNLLLRKYTDMGLTEDMTEKNMTEKIGIFRIWNCGLIKYKWLNKI